jgi:hypothetical protein
VEAEPTHNGLKLIVHNYGHGKREKKRKRERAREIEKRHEFNEGRDLVTHTQIGGSGWTLCWGTAMEAIELVFAHLEKMPVAKL